MSLQIGWTDASLVTNKERILLYSSTYSNMIVMGNDAMDETAIAFDKTQQRVLGRKGGQYYFRNGYENVATFSPTEAYLAGSLNVGQNLFVEGLISSGAPLSAASLSTCNLTVIAPIPIRVDENLPYLTIQRENGTPVLQTTMNYLGDTSLAFLGNVGIGTLQALQTLQVEGGASFRDGVTVGQVLQAPTLRNASAANELDISSSNSILIKSGNTVFRGNAVVEGNFRVDGVIDQKFVGTDNFVANLSLTTQSIIMSNLAPQRASIGILHRGYDTRYNILDLKVRPSESLANPIYDALTLDYLGRLGIGTGTPEAILHVVENSNHARSNLLQVHGDTAEADLVYHRLGRLGVGTTDPLYRMHIYASNEANPTSPLYVISNDSAQNPFFAAMSNQVEVFSISKRGSVTIGSMPPSTEQWDLSIASNLRVPLLQVQSITGTSPSRVLQFNRSSMCNVEFVGTSNMLVQQFRAITSSNQYIFTRDITVPEFDVWNSRGLFQVRIATSHIRSPNVVFADSDANLNNTSDGRVRIYTNTNERVGLLVSGTPPTVTAEVNATQTPQLLLSRSISATNKKFVSLEFDSVEEGLSLKHSDVTQQNMFLFNKDGIFLNNKRFGALAATGQFVIGNSVPSTDVDARLFIRDDVRFDSNNFPCMRFRNDTGRIGFGVNNPQLPLDVQVESQFTRPVRLNNASLMVYDTNGRIGVGTSSMSDSYRLHIEGDVNFTGTLYQRGAFFGRSQWTTDTSISGIFIQGSNVGIGTSAAPRDFGLYVQNPAYFNSNVTIRGLVTTQGSINSISDRAIKANLEPLSQSLEYLKQLTGYRYERKDTGAKECGLIAQDVQKVLPELVRPVGDDTQYLSIAYGNMAALFVEAIKSLDNRLAHVEKILEENAQLESSRS